MKTAKPAPKRSAAKTRPTRFAHAALTPLQRVNYFTGQVLGIDDFRTEQEYLRNRSRRHNLWLHGVGIVTGLQVTIEDESTSQRIVISPGLALDANGNEICVPSSVSVRCPQSNTAISVQIAYAEKPLAPSPSTTEANVESTTQFARIEESFQLTAHATPDDSRITLATIKKSRGRWRVDKMFRPKRIKR